MDQFIVVCSIAIKDHLPVEQSISHCSFRAKPASVTKISRALLREFVGFFSPFAFFNFFLLMKNSEFHPSLTGHPIPT